MSILNLQPAEKRTTEPQNELEVHSIFHTIQGEGPFTGRPATFIRLAGCNLACPLCDTDYTSKRQLMHPVEILQRVQPIAGPHAGSLVVITGGEPFRQDVYALVVLLLSADFTVQIETNGTLPPPNIAFYELCSRDFTELNRCFVVCSPKTGSVNKELIPLIGAYKYVLTADSVHTDGLPLTALGHTAAPFVARPHEGFAGPIYVQPCDSGNWLPNSYNMKAAIDSVMRFEGRTLQLQVHKLLGVE